MLVLLQLNFSKAGFLFTTVLSAFNLSSHMDVLESGLTIPLSDMGKLRNQVKKRAGERQWWCQNPRFMMPCPLPIFGISKDAALEIHLRVPLEVSEITPYFLPNGWKSRGLERLPDPGQSKKGDRPAPSCSGSQGQWICIQLILQSTAASFNFSPVLSKDKSYYPAWQKRG